jgi:hypothetical protein
MIRLDADKRMHVVPTYTQQRALTQGSSKPTGVQRNL